MRFRVSSGWFTSVNRRMADWVVNTNKERKKVTTTLLDDKVSIWEITSVTSTFKI